MQVAEVQEAKAKLERSLETPISEAVNAFHKETRCRVGGISVSFVEVTALGAPYPTMFAQVSVSVEI